METINDSYLLHCPHCGTANRVPAASEGKAGKCGSCHALLPPLYSKPVMLTDRSFDAFVKSYHGPVLAEFWASWCPHCRNFAQAVQEVAEEMAGKGVVVQVNTEESPQLAGRFNIRSVPAVMALLGGRVTGSESGAMDKHSLLAWWQRHLA
jgi:thioredoxin 2